MATSKQKKVVLAAVVAVLLAGGAYYVYANGVPGMKKKHLQAGYRKMVTSPVARNIAARTPGLQGRTGGLRMATGRTL